ncbi:MAG: RNA polymerase factor sigma-54 [Alphaproteobacteria bacterium]|nr:RNA polymerase factor sigma-54 [Alphaproteobacteria bacterium]
MTLSQRLDTRQSQTLIMTPQLQQAIKLLQLTNLELGDYVEQELEKNPLLERTEFSGLTAVEANSAPEGEVKASPSEPEFGSEYVPSDGDDSWSDGLGSFRSQGTGSSNDDDFLAANNVAVKPSLRTHLFEQINVDFQKPAERMVAASLVELLDEAGYLPAGLDFLCGRLRVSQADLESVIGRLQRFDPCGIFARSLHECLALQLHEKGRLDPAMGLLLQHLDLLARRENTALMRICNVSAEDLTDMIAEIRRLNPKPATAFGAELVQPIVPDVFLRSQPGAGWHVELNTDTLPRVLANERYYSRIQAVASTKAEKEFIADHWQQANWLIKAMHQRAVTILKVSTEIVRQQNAFFTKGVHHLKPLILRDIAEAVDMHESTVSRVTQHKYIATPRGIFELKYFFTTALARSDGGADMSSEAVRARIRALIDAEDPMSILSDDHLSMRLRGEGIDIARRTVAKYRESMRIQTSSQRRREKKAQHRT